MLENPFINFTLIKVIENHKDNLSFEILQNLSTQSFELFKSLFNSHYGSVEEDENLVEIHTGGWSDNEWLIEEFKKSLWWQNNFYCHITGGHYYFNLDINKTKEWQIKKVT